MSTSPSDTSANSTSYTNGPPPRTTWPARDPYGEAVVANRYAPGPGPGPGPGTMYVLSARDVNRFS